MSAAPKESEWARRQRRAQMRAAHDGLCDICGAAEGEVGLCGAARRRGLDEDHDHRTQEHRGFICARANRQLWPWVTPEWLFAAALYLAPEVTTNLALDHCAGRADEYLTRTTVRAKVAK